MRPIALDLNGFASFREAAQVDFTDADFFALVGPTGSGKSTIIDAMTFALYGSVPRWGRKGMVSLALAPTVARGTVKLVFEVGGDRYVVARELRRLGGQVSQRAASLERLADPAGRAAPGEDTEVLARDVAAVTETVERLLGLSYEDFCQCVVLPQGQFASLLHAKPSERQEILLRLLGAEHYRQMMMRANQRATSAAQRAEAHGETLAGFADATEAALDAARAAEKALTALKDQVAEAVPRIRAAEQELAAAESELARLRAEQAALAGIRVPDDVPALDAGLRATRSALEQARTVERIAEESDGAARAALAAGPSRGPLERARDHRAELAKLTADLPGAHADLSQAAERALSAEARAAAAASMAEEARAQQETASRQHEDAQQREHDLARDHAALAAVTTPAGADQVDQRHKDAAAAVRAATARLRAAEQADQEARAARGSALAPGPLAQALRDLTELRRLVVEQASARVALDQALAAAATTQGALRDAEVVQGQRQQALDDARRANVAADLRPHLVPGHACPVCEQVVSTLPEPLDAPAIGQAQARLDASAADVAAARKHAGDAASARDTAAAVLTSLADHQARLLASLTATATDSLAGAPAAGLTALLGHESGQADAADAQAREGRVDAAIANLDDLLRQRQRADAAAEEAGAAVSSARERAGSAQARLDRAEADVKLARSDVSAARDPLVGLGAPPADDTSLAAAWARLTSWAQAEASAKAADLASARTAARDAATVLDGARANLARAQATLATSITEARSATGAEQGAKARLAGLRDRADALGELLRGAPDENEVAEQLALVTALEEATAQASGKLLTARSGRADAERALAELEQAESAARTFLGTTRDPLVALGAPAVADQPAGPLGAWTQLATWAAAEAAARDRAIVPAGQAAAQARASLSALTAGLSTGLAHAGIDIAPEAVAASAASEAAGALERAKAASARIAERLSEAAELSARREAELDEQQVSRMLGDLLRSDRFPRWLVTAAVDVLVGEASGILAGLSNGQYDLTHEDGDFYIVDHADADSRRSVRTLSGGETFQASLALALALSSQMTALATAGAARLDSIFLDEGFGTLDPETLEVVAATLESLAQGQRMVGIITHVAALAERVPVRYLVSRDARTSTVIREGLPAADAA